jgi:vacuolar-type H+-ATPase subunit I/STV1
MVNEKKSAPEINAVIVVDADNSLEDVAYRLSAIKAVDEELKGLENRTDLEEKSIKAMDASLMQLEAYRPKLVTSGLPYTIRSGLHRR